MSSPQTPRPPLRALTTIFARALNLAFGGGDPAMALLERELVSSRGWLTPADYSVAYGLARLTPGTNVLAFCAAVAWLLRGWLGAFFAVVVASAPSAIVVVLLTYGYQAFKANPLAASAIAGLLASAVGMMGAAAWNLTRPHLRSGQWLRALVLAGGSVLLLVRFSLSPIAVLGLAALVGFFWRTGDAE